MASSVNLGEKLEAAVARMVKDGRFNSRSEVLREGVRLIDERETKLAAFNTAVLAGLADVEAGRVHELDEVLLELDEEFQAAEVRRRA